MMKKIILAAAVSALMTGSAFAQAGANQSAPQPSSDGRGVNQPAVNANGTAMDRADSNKGTSGMSGSTKKDGMSKNKKSK
jgi:uncharacterized protein YdeI (BOF family)